MAARARAALLVGIAIQSCIVAGGGLVGHDTARGLAAGLYRETGATRCRERHDTALEARDTAPCVTIRCAIRRAAVRDTTRSSAHVRAATWHDMPATRTRGGHDTVGARLQHDRDMALCARPGPSGRAAWVQGVHLVHLTQFLLNVLF